MGLLTNRMSLVILEEETLNISNQLGSRFPAVIRGWIPSSADKVTCPLPVLHGGSRYAPRESVDHRENLPVVPVEVERQGPAQLPGLQKVCGRYEQVLTNLREDLEH